VTREELASELEAEGLDEAAAAEPGRTSAWSALEHRDFPSLLDRPRCLEHRDVDAAVRPWLAGRSCSPSKTACRTSLPFISASSVFRAPSPGLAFGLFGGVVADRADRRRLLLVTQSSAAVLAGVLAFLAISIRSTSSKIVLISALNSIIFRSTRHAAGDGPAPGLGQTSS